MRNYVPQCGIAIWINVPVALPAYTWRDRNLVVGWLYAGLIFGVMYAGRAHARAGFANFAGFTNSMKMTNIPEY